MQIHKNLWLQCDQTKGAKVLTLLRDFLTRSSAGVWVIDQESMDFYGQLDPTEAKNVIVIAGHKLDDCCICANASASVYICYLERRNGEDGQTGLQVTNIVPRDGRSSLTVGEYNNILDKCYQEVIRPATDGMKWEKTSSLRTYCDVFSPRAAEAFLHFVQSANKSSAASHPSDEKAWFDFLLACHAEMKTIPSADEVERLLIEDYSWDREAAQRLAVQFEMGMSLLRYEHGVAN